LRTLHSSAPIVPALPSPAIQTPAMKVFSPQSALLVFTALMTFVPVTLQAQSQAATPSQTPAPKSAPNAAPPKYTEEQMQEMIGKLQDRIKKAADSVIGRIQKEEAGVHLKFSYFRKPERLDPNTYGSKEDVVAWRDSLQKLKDQENGLDKLYADAEQDLGNALVQQRVNQSIADQIKNELLKTFPWAVIKRKSSLMREFIAEHDELLTFYDKNWGSWQPASEGRAPIFADPKVAATFQALKDKTNATGALIEDQYKMMMQ
jgi:hypothetical protein